MRRQPVPAGELIEVRAGIDAAIEILDAESLRIGRVSWGLPAVG
jgi:hypothetical protein